MHKRVRAIIIQNGKVLLIHRIKGDVHYWVFPGGGMEDVDLNNSIATLKRECREELGVEIAVGELFGTDTSGNQNEEFYFATINGNALGTGHAPESKDNNILTKGQYIIEWLTLEDISNRAVYPERIKDRLLEEWPNLHKKDPIT